jgi:hypothetical protein
MNLGSTLAMRSTTLAVADLYAGGQGSGRKAGFGQALHLDPSVGSAKAVAEHFGYVRQPEDDKEDWYGNTRAAFSHPSGHSLQIGADDPEHEKFSNWKATSPKGVTTNSGGGRELYDHLKSVHGAKGTPQGADITYGQPRYKMAARGRRKR